MHNSFHCRTPDDLVHVAHCRGPNEVRLRQRGNDSQVAALAVRISPNRGALLIVMGQRRRSGRQNPGVAPGCSQPPQGSLGECLSSSCCHRRERAGRSPILPASVLPGIRSGAKRCRNASFSFTAGSARAAAERLVSPNRKDGAVRWWSIISLPVREQECIVPRLGRSEELSGAVACEAETAGKCGLHHWGFWLQTGVGMLMRPSAHS
ncbi:uncharacterized protein LOC116226153 [Phasianus colchicus]|uniref:uncharacterized protein LOC116226153 n=1 Tax=Phasianus colchicus TaxID=9054 RepID=UPI00129D63A1|nr:uncharacterized protein LOC116226153 [Phasianus colchicus]